MAEKAKKTVAVEPKAVAEKAGCTDKRCPTHGGLKTRGLLIEGKVVGNNIKSMAIVEIQYIRKISKYERFEKRRRKIHVHVPMCKTVTMGQMVKCMECRKLSKTKSFVLVDN